MELILWVILCISFVYLMIYFLSLGSPASTASRRGEELAEEKRNPINALPISIIICAHNEADNLQKNLPSVLNQSHSNFEVIVANDNSTDETESVLNHFQKAFHHLKVIEVKAGEKKFAGKKELLAKAMRAAKHETIVVTDADCFPASDKWLNTMSHYAGGDVKVVLGYSPFTDTDSVNQRDDISAGEILLNKLIRFEATQTAWQYFANAIKGKAYMGVGRNMLFRKTDYLNWFETTEHKTAGGDDDLFVNWLVNEGTDENGRGTGDEERGTKVDEVEKEKSKEFTDEKSIAVCLDESAFVFTEPEKTYTSWLQQKTRHTQASYYYTWSDKIKLFGFALAQFGLYAASIALLYQSTDSLMLVLSIITSFSVMQMLVSRNIYNTLRQQDITLWIPLLQPLYVFSISLIFLLSLIKRSDTWN